ncbi:MULTISPECIES: ATP-binding protein [Streptomyces]|mgnify:CR=1 FL=1|uniref:ATP-binding protein n=1 Tax=Streptomyces thermoviolaceus subsp. thermoviolaceus TaxID=66860 RepID=A0ABX0YPX8_STRTL|nr:MULTISPECIES: ATP-binding protein [Streptomyces]MCM3262461.1 ATP-binding protein [Streptomyces thermoviolaceus]NJP14118.1 ATP-binding protein [Streptomyces thermoviolaceus subsp. thermoviolaceus]RSS02409.1 ATP-binding protein [Streptomyces sp. WAC00469]WTD50467.1 ATP-binding protein [Streptomyces thermoviolaceus]GGV62949.1 ATP-binding protein [Streptomyces thermoviolaceus subsp. apingens]
MAREPHGDDTLATEGIPSRTEHFAGELHHVTGARLVTEEFLDDLARRCLPATPEHWDDILLVVTELAANAVQYAPGPFVLRLRRTFDGVHVTLSDTSRTPPAPRPFRPSSGGGGIGWHLIHTLSDQVSVVVNEHGKDIHVFLPW